MSEQPNLDDIIEPTEQATPDHHEHAKTPKHLNDGALEERTQHERDEVDADDTN